MKTTEQILQRIVVAQDELNNFVELRKEEKQRPHDERDEEYLSFLHGEIKSISYEIITLRWVMEGSAKVVPEDLFDEAVKAISRLAAIKGSGETYAFDNEHDEAEAEEMVKLVEMLTKL